MAPSAGECINVLEASSERLQDGLDKLRQEQVALHVATCKKFAMLKQSISALSTKTQASIDALGTKMQASIDTLAVIVQMQQASQAKDTTMILAILMSTSEHTSACGTINAGDDIVVANAKRPSISGTACVALASK
jgi:hypothetical protein